MTMPSTRPDASRMRFTGSISALTARDRARFMERSTSSDASVQRATARILERVRRDGDAALFALARQFDDVALEALEVPHECMSRALDAIDPAVRTALRRAADNIASVHRAFVPFVQETRPERGVVVGRRPDPLRRVGIYAPGGSAAYPSSVLMGAVPARVAGVREVVLCSPPGPAGRPSTVVLAAAALAGVDRVFALGGAGAIGAMAYGTATVPRVDRVVGPGNAYVAEAKLQVSGAVAIDAPAGPSELLVIADSGCDAAAVAREMVAQAEHDTRACVVAVAVHADTADRIRAALSLATADQPRRSTIEAALAAHGGVLVAESLAEAVAFANEYAAEHVLLAIEEPDSTLARLRNAGTVFLGESASVSFGDYITGANHVLPTGGMARCYSGLSLTDFFRWTTYQRVDRGAAAAFANDVATLAMAEQLPAHAAAASASTPTAFSIADPRGTIELSDNTNLWGAPPAALRVIRAAAASSLSRYPSAYGPSSFTDALLRYCGVRSGGAVTGCGSDQVIDSTFRAFATAGDRVAFCAPTFSMVPILARLNGLVPTPVPFRENLDLDAERLVATGAEIIYVCAPNNPTGTPVSRSSLEYVVANAPGIVLLDEAYAEFARATHMDLVETSQRLLVVRTFSKAFGLAGLRIGYGVGARALIREVAHARGPYAVNALALRAAQAALADDADGLQWVRSHAGLARTNRERLAEALTGLGLAPLLSDANFVFVPTRRAEPIASVLAAAGIRVRMLADLPTTVPALAQSGGTGLRIGVGPWESMTALLDVLSPARRGTVRS